MRREPTYAEKVLWKAIRGLDGFHFRRQVPLGPYVVDFASHRMRLVVEVDGGVHDAPDAAARDAEREDWLKARGYRIVRLSNETAIRDTGTAIAGILAGAELAPHPPTPSRKGKGSYCEPLE